MNHKILLAGVTLILILSIAACGSVAQPEYAQEEEPTIAPVNEVAEEPTEEPSATSVPPTEVPPTEVPTEAPTATPVPPTEVPTEAPTEEPASASVSEEEARIAAAVEAADAANGESLFAMYACSSCHLANTDDPLVGPGLLNVYEHAATRVEGQGPYEYVFTAIRSSQEFIVEGFAAGVMPAFDHVSDEDIYDIMAYLATLGE